MVEEENPGNVCNDEQFNALFRNLSPDLYKFLFYKYGEEHNPLDIVQDAFIKLWDNCKKVSPIKAKGYLYTVANNLMLSSLAKKKTIKKFAAEPQNNMNIQGPEFELEGKEYKAQLNEAIASLTEEQRVTLFLNRIEGKKHKEIAEMLGISRKAVEKRIYTAIAKIREQVEFF